MFNTSIRRATRVAAQVATAASFVAVLAIPVHAQPPAGGGGGGNRGMQMMMEGITLSAAQQTKVDSIVGFYREKSMALGRPQQGDTTGMGARRKITADRNAALKAVLTADQAKTFDANMAKMPQMGGGQRPPAR